ncbi:MAG: PQQ-binding-like beta-propeller repeat protein, partial [Verrucomicrobiales bacterium]
TPTIQGASVYAMGATGFLDCLDLTSGELRWSRDVLEGNKAGNAFYGKACSPLFVGAERSEVEGGMVVVTGGGEGGPTVLAFRAIDGKSVWSAGEDGASYASPVLAPLAGRWQIVSVNANSVTGHAVTSGEILWSYRWPSTFPRASQPRVLPGDRVLLTASYGMGNAMLRIVAGGGEAGLRVERLWESLAMKTKFSNVCLRQGYAYGLDEGRLACMDLKTGKRVWKGGKYGYGQNLLAGAFLVIQVESGEIALARADPLGFEGLARIPALGGKTWNTPALAGGILLLRNDREAVAFHLPLVTRLPPAGF